MDKNNGSIMGERAEDNTQLAELVVTAPSNQINVLRKTELLVERHPKVANSERKSDMREGLCQQMHV
jgi:hypothetical protein